MVEEFVVGVVGKRLGAGEQGGDRGMRIGDGRQTVGDSLVEGRAHGRSVGVDRGGDGVGKLVGSSERPLREVGAVATELGDDRGAPATGARPRCDFSSSDGLGGWFDGGDGAGHGSALL